MNMENYLIDLKVSCYNRGVKNISKKISNTDLNKYLSLIKIIRDNCNHSTWNWWNILSEIWDGNDYVPDEWKIKNDFKKNFGVEFDDVDIIISFFNRFVPNDVDSIEDIKIYEFKEVEF